MNWPELPSGAALIDAARRSADHLVQSASERLRDAGINTTTTVLEGHPRIAVADYAKEWGADLVLVGSHGAGGLVRFLMGSTAQAVLRNSPCSVEIVRRAAPGPLAVPGGMKILVATDGSDCSMAAVRSVAERPWPAGSQTRVISVVPVVLAVGAAHPLPPIYLSTDTLETLEEEARGRAEEAIARAQQILREAHMEPAKTEFLPTGDARQVILEEAKDWGTDLIVLGSHGYHGFDRLMLGSVSESVAMHAHCSVEVIRESRPALM
jgi:nucleotide-binding universal stress UspA family protein